MNKVLLWVLTIFLFETAIVVGHSEPTEQTMRLASVTFLKAVMGDLLQNPETVKYFPGVEAEDVTLNQKKELDGRLVRWEYSHGVHYVPADPGAQMITKPVFESEASIIFSIFVANEQHGHGLFMWNKSYKILDDSRLVAGFGVEIGDDSRELQKKVDENLQVTSACFSEGRGQLKSLEQNS